ncbi:MAG: leucyl aminopeptidase family protein [Sporocytophaga sp.]|nr:leucyl aminopeptidase family protein [Sporocytophaga sp.]
MILLNFEGNISEKENLAILADSISDIKKYLNKEEEIEYVEKRLETTSIITVNQLYRNVYIISFSRKGFDYSNKEKLRKTGAELCSLLKKEKVKTIQITGAFHEGILALTEGLALSAYNFSRYKSAAISSFPESINIYSEGFNESEILDLQNIIDGVYHTRNLVNEPVNYLTAEQLGEEFKSLGKEAGFKVEVLDKQKITDLQMGGLLSVNLGSPNPPTFIICEYKPANAINTKPYVLIGKGVVYDTGGLSLKPTPNSMDLMKSDMAGGAAVAGILYAIAKSKLPLYIIGLVPATENRPDGNAMTPGDVIKMYDGTTVEVLNTDAEGRLILADALAYAAQYDPLFVADLATLTGAAARAIGKEGIVYMGTAKEEFKSMLENSGKAVYERLVEFPLWEEYGKQLQSDIADLKNIGSGDAGAITAGKFMEHFVKYDWVHLDIAGSAFLTSEDSYRGKNGTGAGVRLFYDFFKKISQQN